MAQENRERAWDIACRRSWCRRPMLCPRLPARVTLVRCASFSPLGTLKRNNAGGREGGVACRESSGEYWAGQERSMCAGVVVSFVSRV